MKKFVLKSGIHLLLLLYCFALFSFSPNEVSTFDQNRVSDRVDECKVSKTYVCQTYSNQIDLQIKSLTENEENAFKKIETNFILFILPNDYSLKLSQFKVTGFKNISHLFFSSTEIIFPFHSFW